LTVGTVATFLLYSRQFSRPINELANVYSVLQTALAGAERLFALFDERPEEPDAPDARPLTDPRGRIEFASVSFGYREDHPVLSDLSFVIPEGTSLALVGPTGSGKTTIVNLLLRFYEATAGRILIDGTDLRSFTRNSVRQNFGVVLQEAWLFRGTIEQNIAFGRPDATADEVRAAAARARCDAFVRQLPHGYATVLTENGAPLSQGQRQLVAIARALLADPAFLILDEATSNVDTRTELLLQNAVREALHGRTSIVIAHRLSTIRDAGRILFLEGGRVVESGTHDELMRANGRYRAMLNLQTTASDTETAGAE
jgi:ATP-binding cassette subfamily B protein